MMTTQPNPTKKQHPPTKKWWKMAAIYAHFSGTGDWDFSDEAAQAMFDYESKGTRLSDKTSLGKYNGFLVGKRWMDLTITEYWIPDLFEGKTLFAHDLCNDPSLPKWFLDKVLPQRFHKI